MVQISKQGGYEGDVESDRKSGRALCTIGIRKKSTDKKLQQDDNIESEQVLFGVCGVTTISNARRNE